MHQLSHSLAGSKVTKAAVSLDRRIHQEHVDKQMIVCRHEAAPSSPASEDLQFDGTDSS